MRSLFLFFTLLTSIRLFSQEDTFENFKLKNGSIYFECIYDVDMAKEEIIGNMKEWVKTIPSVSNVSFSENQFTGSINNAVFPYKNYINGGSIGELLKSPYTANFVIDIKDNKYRVIVTSIYFRSKYGLYISGVSGKIEGGIEELAYLKRKDKLITRKNWLKFPQCKAFENYLWETFDFISQDKITTEDW